MVARARKARVRKSSEASESRGEAGKKARDSDFCQEIILIRLAQGNKIFRTLALIVGKL